MPPFPKTENPHLPYGYIIAAVCFSIQAVGIGTHVAFGVFFNPLMDAFGWSRAFISGASSVAFLIMGFFGVLVGRLNDRFGPRKLMTVTALLFGTGLMLMSQMTAKWQLYLFYGLICGLGLSSVDVIALTTIARWFARKRGTMTGIVKVGTGAGQFTIPLVAGILITTFGWRSAYVVIGAADLVILVAIAQLLKKDPDDHNAPTVPKASSLPATETMGVSFHQALRTYQLWLICLANAVMLFCLIVIMIHIVPHARDMGLNMARAAGVLSTIGGVSMIGRFATGFAIDRVGSKRMMICYFLLLIGDLLWLQTADTTWKIYLFACFYGLAHGGFFTTISTLVAELFGIRAHGALFGLVAFWGTVGGAIGPTLAGYLYDTTGTYTHAFWIITAMAAVGCGLVTSLRPLKHAEVH